MLSASISNHAEIADWISSVRDKTVDVVRETERKVPLRLGFLNPRLGIVPLATRDKKEVSGYVKDFYSSNNKDRKFKGRGARGQRNRKR